MSAGASKQIFLSYSTTDLVAVEHLVTLLRDEGFTVWRDRDDILSGAYRDDLAEVFGTDR